MTQQEQYSLKDFNQITGLNFIERAKRFQLYIDQLDKDHHQPYYMQSLTCINSKMIVEYNYTHEKKRNCSICLK